MHLPITHRWRKVLSAIAAVALLSLTLLSLSACDRRSNRVVVGSKNFTENLILAEMFAQVIESRGHLPVDRRFYLQGTFICQQALLAGRIDLYPEYTGTALAAVLKELPTGDKQEVYRRVQEGYKKFGLEIGPPLGFNDTFAMIIRGEDARRFQLRTLSQAATFTPKWRAGFGYEFMERPDGYKGLVSSYNLRFAEPPRIMDLGLLTRALKDRQVDIIAGNNTDGLIRALDFFVLDDDHHYFPPYEAVAIMRGKMLEQHPEVKLAVDALAGVVSDDDMRQLNYAVDGGHRDPTEVVREFLRERKLVN